MDITHRTVQTNGITMHIAEAGSGPLVVLCHGFPELWYSWRHQIPALADAGYHVVAPDQRGYGDTDRPEAVEEYDIDMLSGDLVGLLDALDEPKAVFVGHDWGAPVVWHTALRSPGRVAGIAALSVPYTGRQEGRPTETWKAIFGDVFFYMLYFQERGPADEELGADVRRTIRSVIWTLSGEAPPGALKAVARGAGFLDSLEEPSELPAWISEDDIDVFVRAFERTGFTGGLNWYRNFDRNWERGADLAGAKVVPPALFVGGDRDPVLAFIPVEAMGPHVGDLRGTVILPGAGHWTQQERPREVNEALVAFMQEIGW